MSRHEKALFTLAAVLLFASWALCRDTMPPQVASTNGQMPIEIVLWQFKQVIAPPFALIGLTSAVGVLFLRAVRWGTAPMPVAPETATETETEPGQQPD